MTDPMNYLLSTSFLFWIRQCIFFNFHFGEIIFHRCNSLTLVLLELCLVISIKMLKNSTWTMSINLRYPTETTDDMTCIQDSLSVFRIPEQSQTILFGPLFLAEGECLKLTQFPHWIPLDHYRCFLPCFIHNISSFFLITNLFVKKTSGSRHYRPTPSSAYAIHLVY